MLTSLNILTFCLTAIALQVWFLMVTVNGGFTRVRSLLLVVCIFDPDP